MSESYTLPTKPEGIVAALRERFNSGKVSAMMTLYEPGAVFIAKDGRVAEAGAGQVQRPRRATLRYVELFT